MECNVITSGVGGQGIVLASKLIASAAMKKGFFVRTSETIGMAQRGGSVTCHIRIGSRDKINSPLVGLNSADLIIALELAEGLRQLPYLKKDGAAIVSDNVIQPTAKKYDKEKVFDFLCKSKNVFIMESEKINKKCMNIALLGAAVKSGKLPFFAEELGEIIQENIPKKYLDMNTTAYAKGKEIYEKSRA